MYYKTYRRNRNIKYRDEICPMCYSILLLVEKEGGECSECGNAYWWENNADENGFLTLEIEWEDYGHQFQQSIR